MINLNRLTNTLSSLYSLSRYTPRRKVKYKKVGKTELIMEIYLELKLLEFSGDTYWNYSKVLDGIYRRKGFPCKSDKDTMDLFTVAINFVEGKFVPMLGRRRNFSFTLKEDDTGVTARFLTH